MDDESSTKKLLGEWINLKTMLCTYLAIVIIPCLGIMGAGISIENDLERSGYESVDTDDKNLHMSKEALSLLIPGKTLTLMCDALDNAGKLHRSEEYRNLVIKNGLEKGLIKKITFNKHQ
jgi:hypothetical protein